MQTKIFQSIKKLNVWAFKQTGLLDLIANVQSAGFKWIKSSEQVFCEKVSCKPEQVFCEPVFCEQMFCESSDWLHREQWQKQDLHASSHSFRREKLHRHHIAGALE